MVADVLTFNAYTLPRILQLIQRSNQFNLRTIRYTENQIHEMIQDESFYCIAFALQDKFSNYDIVSLVILKEEVLSELFIDTWIMSCRVLKRGLEHFVLNHIVAVAKEKNCTKLSGEYIPTSKNALVESHYDHLNFQKEGDRWVLNCDHYIKKECFISKGQKEYAALTNVT
jgi:FkbH-like protein